MGRIFVADEDDLRRLLQEALTDALRAVRADELVDARTSGLGPTTFRRLVRTGVISASLVGRRLVAKRSEVEAYLARQRVVKRETEPAQAPADPLAKALALGQLRVLGRK